VSDCHETVRRHKSCNSQETRTLHAICTRFSNSFCTRLAHACDGRHADVYGAHATRLSRDSQETKIYARDFSRDFCKGFIQRAPSFLKDRGGEETACVRKLITLLPKHEVRGREGTGMCAQFSRPPRTQSRTPCGHPQALCCVHTSEPRGRCRRKKAARKIQKNHGLAVSPAGLLAWSSSVREHNTCDLL